MATEQHDDRFLTVAEVAVRLRIHPITVRRHIKAGRLRAVRIGRAVRVPEEELRRLLRSGSGREVPESRRPTRIGERALGYSSGARRGPLTSDELAREERRKLALRAPRQRKPFDDMQRLRDKMKPLGISTAELVGQARSAREWMYKGGHA